MNIRRFEGMPVHRNLLEKAVDVLRNDERVKGLYLSGTLSTDEFSDIDLMVLSSQEDRIGLEKNSLEIAKQVGDIMSESMSTVPHTYVVVYEPGIKMDYSFHMFPEKPRSDKVFIDVLYDPTGHLEELVEKSKQSSFSINHDELQNLVQHYYVVFMYTLTKLGRGEFWESRDCVEYYRGLLVRFEHILEMRKQEGYRRLEQKLSQDRLFLLKETIPLDTSRVEAIRTMDKVIEYFDRYLKPRFVELGVFPVDYSENMMVFYENEKKKILALKE